LTTTRELLTGALRLINVVQANEVPSAQDMEISLEALNALMDSKSTELLNIHTFTPHRFLLVPGQFEYTLGPGGDWSTERPMRLEQSKLMLHPLILTPPVPNFSGTPLGGDAPLTVSFTQL